MEIPKLIILLYSAYYCFASHDVHTIPVENYQTELQNLGQHVEIPETPVRVIKITKTVAVKVPVPYPVKVIQKVPYPVHVSKPYPVPVPHIVKVPQVESPKTLTGHEALGSNNDLLSHYGQDSHSHGAPSSEDSYDPESQSYKVGFSRQAQHFTPATDDYNSHGLSANSYEAPSPNYYGSASVNDGESFESNSYDDAIKSYFDKVNSGVNTGHGLQNYNYH